MTLRIAEQVDSGIELTADFPSLRGEPATDFTYKLTITNNTPEEQTFTFDPSGAAGLDGHGVADRRGPRRDGDDRRRRHRPGQGHGDAAGHLRRRARTPSTSRSPPPTARPGKIELTAEVTGTPKLALATADQRLDVSGRSNIEQRIPLIVANSGTAPLEDVKLAGTAPTGWDVSFDPEQIADVKPNETAQVDSHRQAGERCRRRRLRHHRPRQRGQRVVEPRPALLARGLAHARVVVAIGVIVVAVAALAGVFVRFGRR